METEIQKLNNRIKQLEDMVYKLSSLYYKDNLSDIQIFNKRIKLNSGLFGGNNGLLIGSGLDRIGFFGLSPTTQPQSTGETTGASDIAVTNATTFNGNNGSTAYTILDVVKHLKNLGILKK